MTLALAASLLTLVFTLCYGALCAASPFGNCRKCKGFGYALKKDRRGRLKPAKTCRRCRGDRRRIRAGRHLFNVAVRIQRDGTR